MEFNLYKTDLQKLNSLTKYPSIRTYHKLDKGILSDERNVIFPDDREVIWTEKVDGTNARLILLPHSQWIIGSREELLYASGDLLHNSSMGIVEAFGMDFPDDIAKAFAPRIWDGEIKVLYFEVYGGRKQQNWRNYGNGAKSSYRLFDISTIPVSMLSYKPEEIAAWRDSNSQYWSTEAELYEVSRDLGLKLTPRFATMDGMNLPETVAGMWADLQLFRNTLAALDDSATYLSEGVVLRTHDRRYIAKVRHQDYDRTMARRQKDGT